VVTGDGPDHELAHRRACLPKVEHVAAERLRVSALNVAPGHIDVDPKKAVVDGSARGLSSWSPSSTMTVDPVTAKLFPEPSFMDNRGSSRATH
jgi:hypothetical protein